MDQIGDIIPAAIQPENTENTLKAKTCEKCGAEIMPIRIGLLSKTVLRYPPCQCEIEWERQQKEERQKLEQQRQIERLFQNSGLGPRHRSCTLESFKRLPGTEAAFRAAGITAA